MSDVGQDNGSQDIPPLDDGILAALPRTRPQRASPRRAAARSAVRETSARDGTSTRTSTKTKTDTKPKAKAKTKTPRAQTPRAQTTRRHPVRSEPPAPKQGYEPEDEVELGTTVNPPSGTELVESVADIIGELASSGLSAAGRLLKDAFSPLRRS